MRVLIDGHNVLGAITVRGRTHEEQRHALLAMVASRARDAVVYFDARKAPEGLFDRESLHGVLAEYCRHGHADEAILDAVRNARLPADLMVVSNDREVTGTARQLGAKTARVQDFFKEREAPEPPRVQRRYIKTDYKPSDFGLPDEVDLENPNIE